MGRGPGPVKPQVPSRPEISDILVAGPSAAYHPASPMNVAELTIVKYPAAVLRRPAEPIDPIDDRVRTVAARMIELMHQAEGVGLAGPQVGLPWRIFVANPTGEPDDDRVFINPSLVDPTSETAAREEGCLSIPYVRAEITRPVGITIRALDEHGQPFELTGTDLPARVWQHETDHLDGVLIIDRMTPIDRMSNRRQLRELEALAGA